MSATRTYRRGGIEPLLASVMEKLGERGVFASDKRRRG